MKLIQDITIYWIKKKNKVNSKLKIANNKELSFIGVTEDGSFYYLRLYEV